jgi:pyridoxal biosynthesis lyase PdxS
MTILEQLTLWKENFEEKKLEKVRLEGERAQLLRNLKEEFGCDSVEEAKKRLNSYITNIKKIDKQLEEEAKNYASKYGVE